MTGRYPLLALLKLRTQSVDEQVATVVKHVAHKQAIRQKLERARVELLQQQAAVDGISSEQTRQLGSSALSSAELSRFSDWQKVLRAKLKQAALRVSLHENELARAEESEAEAKQRLTRVKAELMAVEEHHRSFERAVSKQREKAEERVSEEAFLNQVRAGK